MTGSISFYNVVRDRLFFYGRTNLRRRNFLPPGVSGRIQVTVLVPSPLLMVFVKMMSVPGVASVQVLRSVEIWWLMMTSLDCLTECERPKFEPTVTAVGQPSCRSRPRA